MIGQTILHYSIVSKLGMGEVYDQKLGRDVAIKVLAEEFAKDVDRAARFQREAKLLASLNYPNIASIYGVFHIRFVDKQRYFIWRLVLGAEYLS